MKNNNHLRVVLSVQVGMVLPINIAINLIRKDVKKLNGHVSKGTLIFSSTGANGQKFFDQL